MIYTSNCSVKGPLSEEKWLDEQEKPRNHLDMRHRLDSKGQRQGKLIDYRYRLMEFFNLLSNPACPPLLCSYDSSFFSNRVSDLRVVELLDGLCDKMQDYTLEKVIWLSLSITNVTLSFESADYVKVLREKSRIDRIAFWYWILKAVVMCTVCYADVSLSVLAGGFRQTSMD